MSKEYASLLAQVIPVFMLALGLEIRAQGERGRTYMQAHPNRWPRGWAWVAGASTVALGSLAGIEIKALYVVSGSGRFWADTTLPAIIVIIAMLPTMQAIFGLIGQATTNEDRRAGWVVAGLMAFMGLGSVALEFLTV
jgi:hypothetical protein